MKRALAGSIALLATLSAAACGGADEADEAPSAGAGGLASAGFGGSLTGGGLTSSGGTSSAGGGPGNGGSFVTGGFPSAGGVSASGGSAQPGPGGGDGKCCSSGNCICRDEPPAAMTSANGKYQTQSYTVPAGCIYYPTDATPPFSAVAISDGYLGSGGCGIAQTGQWGRFLASHGIVTMIINTNGQDQPATRGTKLLGGVAAFKEENTKSGGQLFGKLAGRYGTAGFSMGGGGTTRATVQDKTLLSSVAIMPYSPQGTGVVTPTLVICGSSDRIASCATHGTRVYDAIPETTPKMRVTVSSDHAGQPSAGSGSSGKWGLAFMKTYLDGDERWKPLLLAEDSTATNIQ